MYYFIINPNSRSGRGREIWEKAKKLLKEKQLPYQAYFTEYIGHARELAKQIALHSEPCTLGVLGGDGTLNEVINGLAETDFSHVTLGCLPTGSGNDFARGLGISKDLETCMNAILSPNKTTLVDVGLSKTKDISRYFLVSSGIGYDAQICRDVTTSPLKKLMNRLHLGKLTYVLVAVKSLILYKPCQISMRLDKNKMLRFPRFFFLAAMNMKYEGGGVKFCPEAEFNDKLLDICLAGVLSKPKILALFPTAFAGKHTLFKGIETMKCRHIDIKCNTPLPIHCDGEAMDTACHVSIMNSQKQIKVILS